MLKINKLVSIICCVSIMSLTLVGCSSCSNKENDKVNNEVNVNGGFSQDKSIYTLATNDISSDSNISIKVPKDITIVQEDNDETSNAYISFFHVQESQIAAKDDYVLTYKLVNEDEIIYDKDNVEKLYSALYKNLSVSDIQSGTYNDINYQYYTITYTSDEETLTDYVFELNVENSFIMAKMGTTFYPLQMDFDTILKTITTNIVK